MRKLFLFSFFVSWVSAGAQGIINNGAFIVMTGAAQVYVAGGGNGDYTSQANGQINQSAASIFTLEGDWTNNAGNSGFTGLSTGTVVLNGAAQTINGLNSTGFYNLTLLGTNTKTLNVDASTSGILSLGTRPLNLNSHWMTVGNSAVGAITYTSGYVISETNASPNPSVLSRAVTGTGNYVYPFGTVGGTQIFVNLNITSGPASTESVRMTTRPTGSNNTPWAPTVTQMFDPTLAQDGSDEAVIDRWWDISATGPVPAADITFRYRGFENTLQVPYNTGNLGGQYWDGVAWVPDNSNIGSAPAVLAGVGAVTVPGQAIGPYIPWVLSSLSAPLPIELTSFTAACNDPAVTLNWSTASELNNDFFTIERSDDGVTFHTAGTVNGSGSSSQVHNYSFTDTQPLTGTTYYRLRQTDYNGQSTASTIITQQPCSNVQETIGAYNSGSTVTVLVNTSFTSSYTVTLVDVQGKLVAERKFDASPGLNTFELKDLLPAGGVYLIRVAGDNGQQYNQKLFFGK